MFQNPFLIRISYLSYLHKKIFLIYPIYIKKGMMLFNGKIFWKLPYSIRKLRGMNYYKDFYAYLKELKLVLS
jgi:hypothetical protein